MIVAATIVTSVAIAAQLLVGRQLLNLITNGDQIELSDVAPSLAALGALLVMSALSQAIAGEFRLPLSDLVERSATNDVLDVATEVDLEAYESVEFHDRLQRAQASAGGQSAAIVFGLVTVLTTTLIAAGLIWVLLTIAPILVPVATIGALPIAFVNFRNNRASYRMERELTELQRERRYYEQLLVSRSDAKEVRSFGIAPVVREWHKQNWDRRLEYLSIVVRERLARTSLGAFVNALVLTTALGITVSFTVKGSITVGDAAVAIVGLQQLTARLKSSAAAVGGVHQGVTFLRDFEQFKKTLPQIRQQRPTQTPPSHPDVISVEAVSYRYPGANDHALRKVSFEARRGQVVAIVGSNGSGKSTLAKLLCSLLPPSEGAIRWDGVDVALCDPELVRAEIAPVFQDFARYLVTIRRSIELGDSRRKDDGTGVLEAARRAGLAKMIAELPAGIDTRLGKGFSGGTDISIGQWQRLAIARAFYRDAPIVILDEPSASLDPRGEAELIDLLRSLGTGRLVIFVSHRFATVRTADLVLVLEGGELVESGSHDELVRVGGLYADMYELQAHRYGFVT
jgi:ATP-binding cassette, subfamily B, bacterial